MLEKIEALPGAQHELAAGDRDGLRRLGQGHADVAQSGIPPEHESPEWFGL